ncbi:glycosyltransferase family 4 protein [Palleronia sp. LCG004]|uniref:glycosyltransferase family 4 protein n=1 Tax=Palleronia sp. LCG004 TaxID=3079304 RepID=UPI0029422A9E|nr:glycosyltransferase family 4 protein [Palleronia sp. LCG004]WOI57576.1 glycosyltransferase family 4 protein [Palleronia sp. LCG004]
MDALAHELIAIAGSPSALADPRVIAPNFKRRLSGVTSTIVRLVPLQAREIAIRATGPGLPDHVPHLSLGQVAALPRRVSRVWHARRNVEMLGGLALKNLLFHRRLRLVFTSASQRQHTGLTKWLIARMDAVVATSGRSAAYLDRPATVIRHGIDTEAFAPATDRAELRARLDLPTDATLVGCFGRIRRSKGTDVFVTAMTELLPRHEGVVALVMGRATEKDRAYAEGLRREVRDAGLEDRIRFLPEVPTHAVAQFHAALDLHVAPQRWEGFGLTPLEAMGSGVPVVATRVGAFEEIVVPGETGELVSPDDVFALGRAIEDCLSDPGRLAAMGRAARKHVARNFTLLGEAQALNRLYLDLLER